jgi:hypothetical protein
MNTRPEGKEGFSVVVTDEKDFLDSQKTTFENIVSSPFFTSKTNIPSYFLNKREMVIERQETHETQNSKESEDDDNQVLVYDIRDEDKGM